DDFPIEDDCRSSQRAGTERQHICSRIAITKTLHVALERFDLRQQIMREKDWLRALQMRVTGHHKIHMLLREIKQRGLQRAKTSRDFCNLRFHIKTKIERDLIVAAACGVQLRTCADSF